MSLTNSCATSPIKYNRKVPTLNNKRMENNKPYNL